MPLALITGSTGFIGSAVTLAVLQAGYSVRLAIRRPEQTQKLRSIFSKFDANDKLDFVVVPDITLPGAFDNALQGVQYILHLASPLAGTEADLLTPAVRGTVSILESALETPGVKKVVVTSSVAALRGLAPIPDGAVLTEDAEIDVVIDPSEVQSLDAMAQYRASKIASYKAVLGFAAERKPAFDVITLHPVYVFGRSLIQSSPAELDGTNRMLFNSLLARTPSTGQFLGVHVEDVALAHIRVLEDDICGVQPYLLSAPRRSWQDVRSFVVDEFPGFEMGLEKNVEDWENWEADTTRATRDLKIIFRPMEDQVRDLVSQQLELRS